MPVGSKSFSIQNPADYAAVEKPPTAMNYNIGFLGKKAQGRLNRTQGYYFSLGTHVTLRSLYYQQKKERQNKY